MSSVAFDFTRSKVHMIFTADGVPVHYTTALEETEKLVSRYGYTGVARLVADLAHRECMESCTDYHRRVSNCFRTIEHSLCERQENHV